MPLIEPTPALDDYLNLLTILDGAPPRCHCLDSPSIYGLRGSREAIYAMRAFVRRHGGIAVAVLQYNAAGEPEGLTEVRHAVDWILDVNTTPQGVRMAGYTKKRTGPQDTICWRFDDAGRPAPAVDFDGLYSVEGTLGAYRFHKYPFKGASYADPWRLADAFKATDLLKEHVGYATAAVAASYAAEGFVTPGDVDDRHRFATAHGLSWLELGIFWERLTAARHSTAKATNPGLAQ